MASGFYGDKLEEIKYGPTLPNKENSLAFLDSFKQVALEQNEDNTQCIMFNSSVAWRDQQLGRKGYASVDINGITYKPGDYVLVRGKIEGL